MLAPRYSVIIPVYNRPQEVSELLESLTRQTYKDFEVILVEDGSTITSEKVYEQYAEKLLIRYFFKPNTGPGPSRNYGFEKARGQYFVMFDSDCVVPEHYFQTVDTFLHTNPLDAWGGPDRGRNDFTPIQQAMAFTMASTLTTGGIRGGNKMGFQPRSFNMGISRKVFEKTGGFAFNRYAEDIELSVRLKKIGFRSVLIPEAYVYHKRRSTFPQFFQQVSNFGRGRVLVGRVHPGEIKPTHWFPAFFLVGLIAWPFLLLINFKLAWAGAALYLVYLLLISIDSFLTTRSVWVSLLSVPAALIQLTGYGFGFLNEIRKPAGVN
jgi:glycosyltransferase involved in cell wall biosynthesis